MRLRTIALLALCCVAAWRLPDAFHRNVSLGNNDFRIFHASAQCIVHGCDRYGVVRNSMGGRAAPNLHPPLAQWLFVPFAPMPLDRAYIAWLVISALAAFLAMRRIARTLELHGIALALACAFVAASAPVSSNVYSGQVGLFLWYPLTVAWTQDRSGAAAGAWPGALLLWKPFLGLLLVARRLWWGFLGAIAIAVAAVALDGVAVQRAWLQSHSNVGWSGHFLDGSLWQMAARVCGPTAYFAPAAACGRFSTPVVLAASVLICGWVVKRSPELTADRGWVLALAAGLLVSPKGWVTYGCWLFGPALAVWQGGDPVTRRLLALAGVFLLVPERWTLALQPSPELTITLGSLYTWTWVLCAVAAYFRRSGRRRSVGPS